MTPGFHPMIWTIFLRFKLNINKGTPLEYLCQYKPFVISVQIYNSPFNASSASGAIAALFDS